MLDYRSDVSPRDFGQRCNIRHITINQALHGEIAISYYTAKKHEFLMFSFNIPYKFRTVYCAGINEFRRIILDEAHLTDNYSVSGEKWFRKYLSGILKDARTIIKSPWIL